MSTTLETTSTPAGVTEPVAVPAQTDPLGERRKRWTTAEFDRLLDAGFLDEGGPEYLWDGDILVAMPENRPHLNAVSNLYVFLLMRLGRGVWTIDQNGPVELEDGTKPQPDLVVLAGPRSRYASLAATAADVALLVEAGDTTYPYDVGVRLRKYASVGISQYWIVNVNELRIEVFTEPMSDGANSSYRERRDFKPGDVVPLRLAHGGNATEFEGIAVSDILRESLPAAPEGQVQ